MGYIVFLIFLCYNYDISHIRSQNMNCMLFGHADAPDSLKSALEAAIIKVSEENDNVEFLVGNNGNFDFLAQSLMEKLKNNGIKIDYTIILSHIDERPLNRCYEQSLFPMELATTIPKYAISKRNNWIIKHSVLAICYVSSIASNSFKTLSKFKKRGVKVINLANRDF